MLIGITIGIAVLGVGAMYVVFANADRTTNQNGGMSNMMQSMMGSGGMMCSTTDVPQNVIIKVQSGQQVPAGKYASVKLLVLEKNTREPLINARVMVGIERGAPMSTMDMIGPMFKAENLGNGKYQVRFELDNPGYYTLHTHVIPAGKSMHSMMDNHMDIGVIVK